MNEDNDLQHEQESAGRLVVYAVQCLLFGMATIAFIVLKLCKVIDWPWIWVFAPIWVPAAAVTALVLIIALGICIFGGKDE